MSSPYVVVRDPIDGRMYVYDTNTLSWIPWDGAVSIEGPITIGTVDQGTGGSSPWLTWSGLRIPAYDYVSLSPADLPTTITFKSGGAGGTTVATLTLVYDGSGNLSTVTKV